VIEINNRWDGGLLYRSETATTVKAAAVEAAKACANLSGADLSGANLSGAYLSGAYLSRADLSGANLSGAYLSGANLSGAYLSGAYLSGAYLSRAYLSRADLSGANLSGAYLSGADLSGAYLSRADLPSFWILPEEGSFIGFKKLAGGAVAKLEILHNARRVCSLVGRKCRAEAVRTLAIRMPDGSEIERAESCGFKRLVYIVGEVTRPDSFNDDVRIECSNGIHFFITMKEAQEYNP